MQASGSKRLRGERQRKQDFALPDDLVHCLIAVCCGLADETRRLALLSQCRTLAALRQVSGQFLRVMDGRVVPSVASLSQAVRSLIGVTRLSLFSGLRRDSVCILIDRRQEAAQLISAMCQLPALDDLAISYPQPEATVDTDLLVGQTKICRLSIAGPGGQVFDATLATLTRLRHLDLGSLRLSAGTLLRLPFLESLTYNYPDDELLITLAACTSLRRLNTSGRLPAHCVQLLASLTDLVHLSLKGVMKQHFLDALNLAPLTRLRSLSLLGTTANASPVDTVPDALEQLSLVGLSIVPFSLRRFTSLHTLSLFSNANDAAPAQARLDESLSMLHSLRCLGIRDHLLPRNWGLLFTALTHLDLEHNQFSHDRQQPATITDEELGRCTALRSLRLSCCHSISGSAFAHLTALHTLVLHGARGVRNASLASLANCLTSLTINHNQGLTGIALSRLTRLQRLGLYTAERITVEALWLLPNLELVVSDRAAEIRSLRPVSSMVTVRTDDDSENAKYGAAQIAGVCGFCSMD